MPCIGGVHHFALTVSDINRSAKWYEELFDLTRVMEEQHVGGGGYGIIMMDPRSNMFMSVHEHDASKGEAFDEGRTGLDHISFFVHGRKDLEEWVRVFQERGVPYAPIADMHYGSVLVFRDLDNIQLEMIAPPGS